MFIPKALAFSEARARTKLPPQIASMSSIRFTVTSDNRFPVQ
jgi:hypothetical protein